MSDKLRRTAPLQISFVEGEQPSPKKLTALNNQIRSALKVVERVVGDPWNQSADVFLGGYSLQIPNLARVIGQQRYLNPITPDVNGEFTFVENIGLRAVDFNNNTRKSTQLAFVPKDNTQVTVLDGASMTNKVASRSLVLASGDYFIDEWGHLFLWDNINTDGQISYVVNANEFGTQDRTITPSVIPDPRQSTFTGCRISSPSPGVFHLHLPPRQPLDLSEDYQARKTTSSKYEERPYWYPKTADRKGNFFYGIDGASEQANNMDSSVVTTNARKLWQSNTVAALNDEWYRYRLPYEIDSVWSGLLVGDALPEGFIHLYDQFAQTIIEGVTFKKTATRWVFEISSATTDFSLFISADESSSSYATKFSIVTVGSSLAKSLHVLWDLFMNHDHADPRLFGTPIEHKNIVGSELEDDHRQYIHTDGRRGITGNFNVSGLLTPGTLTVTGDTVLSKGLNVGVGGSTTQNRINLGATTAYLDHASPGASSTPAFVFDTATDIDQLIYFRATNFLEVKNGANVAARLTNTSTPSLSMGGTTGNEYKFLNTITVTTAVNVQGFTALNGTVTPNVTSNHIVLGNQARIAIPLTLPRDCIITEIHIIVKGETGTGTMTAQLESKGHDGSTILAASTHGSDSDTTAGADVTLSITGLSLNTSTTYATHSFWLDVYNNGFTEMRVSTAAKLVYTVTSLSPGTR